MKLTRGERWALGLAIAGIAVAPLIGPNIGWLTAGWLSMSGLVIGTVIAFRQQRRQQRQDDQPFEDWLRSRSVTPNSLDGLGDEGQDRPHIGRGQDGGSSGIRQRLLSRRPRSGNEAS